MNTSAIVKLSHRSPKTAGAAHLKFYLSLGRNPAIFSMHHVQEVLTLPLQRLTPMPNMAACMLGLMNHRSRILWVVDLALLLGLNRLDTATQQYNLIIIRVGKLSLALAVEHINGMTWLEQDAIQSPLGQTSMGLVPYLQGCIWQDEAVLLVLDAAAISQAPVLRDLTPSSSHL
ncbi:MAG: chemotaxis protein CheW [Leptolyngbyaceae cyanobacterium SM1_1_3]|nr:chemotaxis protein CheW [Leptolyngbyaceae cyanobacterium SM1_1_3]NJN01526.1 chemotaxis protein CheW [Leptolyngbyaceae cyanobacterium RM1_1_2]NJO08669.1 chemotaxis protein CheW [Leptolyngbyaceae cyanobacterium SL_1_1]